MTNGAMMSLGVVDMIMVGRLGPTAIASLSVSVTWMFAIGVFGRNIPASVEPLVSQAQGEKQTEIRGRVVSTSSAVDGDRFGSADVPLLEC